jgi:hypothetical protein
VTRQQALHNHLLRWRDRAFALGSVDCVTFTCEWVDGQCGTQYLQRVRSVLDYTTRLSALRLIAKRGGYEALVTEFTGLPGRREGEYEAGDIAIFSNALGETTLGVLGSRLVYAPSPEGLTATDVGMADCFWRLDDLWQQRLS